MHLTRRAFTLGGATLGAQLQGTLRATPQVPAQPPRPAPTICLFSKHLPTIHYAELGGVLRDLGFAGCDLTVRPGGHVEPALSAADLYRAVEAIRAEGVEGPALSRREAFGAAGRGGGAGALGLRPVSRGGRPSRGRRRGPHAHDAFRAN